MEDGGDQQQGSRVHHQDTEKKINTTASSHDVPVGQALPAAERAVGFKEVAESPARMVGMMMLIAWMAPEREREEPLCETSSVSGSADEHNF